MCAWLRRMLRQKPRPNLARNVVVARRAREKVAPGHWFDGVSVFGHVFRDPAVSLRETPKLVKLI